MKSPLSVTVAGWYIVISAALSIVTIPHALHGSMMAGFLHRASRPAQIMLAVLVLQACVDVVCGVGIVKGLRWARILYVCAVVVGFPLLFFVVPAKLQLIPNVLICALLLYVLFRPEANDYFARVPD